MHSTCVAAVRFADVFLNQAARVLAPLRHDPRTGPAARVMERWTACHFACSDALPLPEIDRTMLQDKEPLAMGPSALDLSLQEVSTTAVPSRSTPQVEFVKETMCSLALDVSSRRSANTLNNMSCALSQGFGESMTFHPVALHE